MHDLPLITTIAAGFAAAWVLGLITQRLGLSPIVGYLLAGIAIGPHTPGYIGDLHAAHQLAEVGVILLMFGVGLHFHFKDLMAVKNVAVPGAIFQSLVATTLGMLLFLVFGWELKAGLVLGMAMAVASTVVLLRVLMDRDMLNSVHGHVAVGWLIVEDIFTVLLLVLIPVIGNIDAGTAQSAAAAATAPDIAATQAVHAVSSRGGLISIGWALLKLIALVAIVLLAGSRVVPWVLIRVAKLRSRELFTLTILVLSITVAAGSAVIFGASMALGAFLAGMVVGQSPVSHQAAADALPLRDAFAVMFFVAVGMLFDPMFIVNEPGMVAAGLAIVLVAKPLAAVIIVGLLGYSARTAITVALGLAQIGEFSFILSQVARDHRLMPEEGHNVLVAVAIISIALNPLVFSRIDQIENWLKSKPRLWNWLNSRANQRMHEINDQAEAQIAATQKPLAIIVGYGPVGRVVDALLRDTGMETVIIDTNMDTISALTRRGRRAIFGDATHMSILEQAGVKKAVHLVIALPHSANRGPLILAARELNPQIEVTVRARYMSERESMREAGASTIVSEEGEAGLAMARQVMRQRKIDEVTIEKMLAALRHMWLILD